ncbi:cellulose binding domain-containing protein [Aquabacterium sp.]|uniref:cellulose binding domain-containing protein n=1 Tax=Aquabacterium sp. TaxID=1872578 RepID=UPI003D6D2B3B
MNRLNKIASLSLLATLGTFQIGVAHAAKWLVQPIQDPNESAGNATSTAATGVNNSGVVVGQKGSGPFTGFVTGPNGVGYQSLGTVYGGIVGVDDAGEVSSIAVNGLVFITPPNSLTLNPIALLPGATQNSFTGISSDGRIVGRNGHWASIKQMVWNQIYFTGPHGAGITEWIKPAQFYDVQTTGINSSGQIIGNAGLVSVNQATGLQNTHALLTGPNATGYQDLGTLGGESSTAAGVNDSGQVAGSSQLTVGLASQHAFLTGPDGTAMKDLGDLGGGQSLARGLNNLGQVVGSSYPVANAADPVAFVTGPNGVGMRNLAQEVSLPGNVALRVAVAINDKGQVVAQDINNQSYLLTPLPELPAGQCAVTYKVTSTGFGLFTAKVNVSNQGSSTQSDWSVNWQYNYRPLLVATNAKIALNGESVTATPTISNKAVKAQSTVSFTLTGTTKSGKVPTVTGLTASLGGKSCTTTAQ